MAAAHDPSVDVARRALERLARRGGPAERPALRRLLWTCDPALTADVARTLLALDDRETVRVAVQRLHDGRSAERSRAARVLGCVGDRRATPALCEALTDRDGSVRAAALDALGRIGDEHRFVAEAVAPLAADPNADVRRHAVRAIGRLIRGPDRAVRTAADDPSASVRREVALLAARLSPETVASLLADRDPQVRRAAAGRAGISAETMLTHALRTDPQPAVRHAAVDALGLLGGPEAGRALVTAALEDADAMVRAAALRVADEILSRPRLAARLRAALGSSRSTRRAMALRAFAKLPAPIADEDALRLSRDPEPDVRLALTHVARAIVRDSERVLAALAEDRDATVAHAASISRRDHGS